MQERAPLNQVQPLALRKSFFDGVSRGDTDVVAPENRNPEFYINNFVVDAPASQSMVPPGTYDEVDRIRWEVQENVLLARKAYEFVTGSDGFGSRTDQSVNGRYVRTNNGLIVAAYRITSHFDLRQGYNPSTGEPINVWEENARDRPWNQREYMRVDWSQNMVDNPDWSWLFYGSIFGDLSFQPVRYNESDPTSIYAPNFCEMHPGYARRSAAEIQQQVAAYRQSHNGQDPRLDEWIPQQGDEQTSVSRESILCKKVATNDPRAQRGGYFDITSKWLVSPEMSNSFGFPLPTCFIYNLFTGSDTYDCNPQEAMIRTSFRRVEDRDFEPLELTRNPYDLVGGPRATRNGYDPGYGTLDRNFHRYQMIHNLWMESHVSPAVQCTSNADANNDGTADQCASARTTSRGSQCDMVMNKCTLPYRDRRVRPIVYYISPGMPAEFQDHIATEDGRGVLSYRLPTDAERQSRTGNFRGGPSEQIIDTWDIAVYRAIASAREVECRKTGGARDMCHSTYFTSDTNNVNSLVPQGVGAFLGESPRRMPTDRGVVLCHNPVAVTDHSSCREVGYSVRLGDIRYNHLTYWEGNSRAPFGGIAHWGFDPLTGEVVSNGGFNMGRSVEFAAAQQRDFIRLIINSIDPAADPLTVEDYLQGESAATLAQHIRNPAGSRIGGTRAPMTDDEMMALANQMAGTHQTANAQPGAAGQNNLFGSNNLADLVRGGNNQAQLIRDFDRIATDTTPVAVSQTAVAAEAMMSRLRGTRYAADLLDNNVLRLMHARPDAAASQDVLDRASLLGRLGPDAIESMRERLMTQAAERGFCFQDAGAPPMVGSVDLQGVARWFLQKYRNLSPEDRARRIYQDLRPEAYVGIALHEVGHSIGLYHLPSSSYDSMNYNPQYWQLRTRNGAAQAACRPATCRITDPNSCRSMRNNDRNTDNCMGPRYIDPASDEELGVRPVEMGNHHAGINYFGNTSTMEYQWERFGETVGLGAYDVYAMGVLYGRVVETMETDPARGGMPVAQQRRFSFRMRSQLQNNDYIYWRDPAFGQTGDATDNDLAPVHYTELARQMNVFNPNRCRDATPAERERYKWRLVDGKICAHAPRDHAALTDMQSLPPFVQNEPAEDSDPESAAPYWRVRPGVRSHAGDLDGNVRWHYRVAWDRGTGYPHINFFDQGADLYETSRSFIDKYHLLYPSMYFRRGNREWAPWGISGAIASRMFRFIRGYHWTMARDINFYQTRLSDAGFRGYVLNDNVLGPTVQAQRDVFDFFAGVLLRPEPGEAVAWNATSALNADNDRSTPESRAGNISIWDASESASQRGVFRIGVVDGRYIGDDFDNSAGGSLDYWSYQRREGANMEKLYAAIMLTDTRPTFSSITRRLYLDGREFQVNFYTDLPDATRRLMGGIMSEDWAGVGMYCPGNANECTPQMLDFRGTLPASSTNPLDAVVSRPAGARVMFPNIGYKQQLALAIYGMLFSSLNSELNIINLFRIWSPGGEEEVAVPPEERIAFRNPETGLIYMARRYGNDPGLATVSGRPVDGGVGSRMIQHANALLAEVWLTDGVNDDGSPRVMRDAQGRPMIRNSMSVQRHQYALRRFREYIGTLDAVRNVSRIFGYGIIRG